MEVIFIAMLLGLIPGMIASGKGRNGFGWWLFGTLLFVLALPASLLISPTPDAFERKKREEGRVPCPQCAEFIMAAAKVCPFCKHTLHE
jgi:hypothetical protein